MKPLAQALLAIASLALCAAAAGAQCLVPSLGPAADVSAASSSVSVVAGDFKRDGKHDLGVAGFDSANVAVLLGDGAGALPPPVTPVRIPPYTLDYCRLNINARRPEAA